MADPASNVVELVRRGMRAAEEPASVAAKRADAKEARHRRQVNLDRAEPDVTDEDLCRLAWDQHTTPARWEAMPKAERKFWIADYPLMVTAQMWLRNTSVPLLFLSGTMGRSKTLAASYVLARHGGAFIAAADLVPLFESRDRVDKERCRQLRGAQVLVVDDLGLEEDAAKTAGFLQKLVNSRRSRGRRTVITTNLDGDQLPVRYKEERLWSRVLQSHMFKADKGPDIRELDR